jgi:hypothetical protein
VIGLFSFLASLLLTHMFDSWGANLLVDLTDAAIVAREKDLVY